MVPPSTIQAEGLVLQRSTNMAGYKNVGQDKSKPRQFQVRMWHNGKQARLVRSSKVRAVPSAELHPLTHMAAGAPGVLCDG